MGPKGVVFICLGNSCRSIMAEALARQPPIYLPWPRDRRSHAVRLRP